MVVAGHGVGWLPESCAADEVREGKLVIVGPVTWTTNLEVRMYWSASSLKAVVKDLCSFAGAGLMNARSDASAVVQKPLAKRSVAFRAGR